MKKDVAYPRTFTSTLPEEQKQIFSQCFNKSYCTAVIKHKHLYNFEFLTQRSTWHRAFSRSLRGKSPPSSSSSGENNDGGSGRDDDGQAPPSSPG